MHLNVHALYALLTMVAAILVMCLWMRQGGLLYALSGVALSVLVVLSLLLWL